MSAVLATFFGGCLRGRRVFFTMPSNRSSFEEAGGTVEQAVRFFPSRTTKQPEGSSLMERIIRGILDLRGTFPLCRPYALL